MTEPEDFDGKANLLAQIPYVERISRLLTFLKLAVGRAKVASSRFDGPVPGQSWVLEDLGRTLGSLLVWVDEGYLSGLEYAWVTEEPPLTLPAVTRFSRLRSGTRKVPIRGGSSLAGRASLWR